MVNVDHSARSFDFDEGAPVYTQEELIGHCTGATVACEIESCLTDAHLIRLLDGTVERICESVLWPYRDGWLIQP